ncbi:MAG: hypothetical protein MUQ10_05230, partial [Anaerolineae bacterium]|nr:hypothetical protein [Anaerolineae bacterium]
MVPRKLWYVKVPIPVFIGLGLVSVFVSWMASPAEVGAGISAGPSRGVVNSPASSTIMPLDDNFILYDGGSDYVVRGKPAIQFDGSNFLSVWMDANTGEMMASRITSDGVRLDDPPITVSDESTPGVNPSVGFDGTNYLVVWVATDWEIYAARIEQDGTLLDPGGVKLTTGSNALPRMLGIAHDGTNYLLVWRAGALGTEVRGTRVNAGGSQPVNLDSASGFSISEGTWSRYPAVAYGDGVYLVAWHKGDCAGGNQSIQAARVSTDGSVLDPANFIINDGDGCQEQAVVGWDGRNFQVAWNNWSMATGKWFASGSATRVTTGAVILDAPVITLSNYVRGEKPFGIACNGQNCLYTWDVDHEDTFNWRITDAYARRIDQDGNVMEEQAIPVSAASGHQFGPMVAHGDGRYLVLWDDRRDNGDRAIIAGQILHSVSGYIESPPGAAKIQADEGAWIEEYLSADVTVAASSGAALSESEAYAFGKGSYHYVDGAWSAVYPPKPQAYFNVWAIAPDDVWAGGWCRSMFHYDGTSWSMAVWNTGETSDWGFNIY